MSEKTEVRFQARRRDTNGGSYYRVYDHKRKRYVGKHFNGCVMDLVKKRAEVYAQSLEVARD